MHRLFIICLVAFLALQTRPLSAAAMTSDKPFEVGVIPYISARTLVYSYEPMRLYLEKVLSRPVKFYSSTNFKSFFQNAQRGDYDLIITAAHFARILQKDNQFIPLVRYATGGRGLVVTALDSPIKTLQSLRGKVIAVPDKISLAAIVCLTYLRENDLESGSDFLILEVPSFASAILSMQKNEANAAISSTGALAQMPKPLSESVKPVVDAGEYTSLIFLAHPRLGKTTNQLINSALLKFGNESVEGKQFFSSNGFGTIVPVTQKEMSNLDQYVAETKRLMEEAP